ncbi:LPD7 domain-containing protein [Duganella sp. BuS-21]|uniref:LPD7 domain-containing protein n=1 Tax=Duganella sp. BuS-21 TaxID=2943848 RepID=UPI0035A68648
MNSIENPDDATADTTGSGPSRRKREVSAQLALPGLDGANQQSPELGKHHAESRDTVNNADLLSPANPAHGDSLLRTLARRLGFARQGASSGHESGERLQRDDAENAPSINESAPQVGDTSPKAPGPVRESQETQVPEYLRNRYVIDANRNYYFRDGDHGLAFEDMGSKIRTRHDEAEIAASMVELALAKGWTHPKLRGSEAFKREAWLAGAERGMQMSGYRPTPLDKARLAERLAARELNPTQSAQFNEIEEKPEQKQQAATPDAKPVRQRKQNNPSPKKDAGRANKNPQHRRAVKQLERFLRQRGDSETAIGMTCQLAAEELAKHRTHFGKLLEHGEARYHHDRDNDLNYFVTLETPDGRETIWGIDLARAITESGTDIGEGIVLAQYGRRGVTITGPERDDSGNTTGKRTSVATHRNDWHVISLDNAREFLRPQTHPDHDRTAPVQHSDGGQPQRIGHPTPEQQVRRAR